MHCPLLANRIACFGGCLLFFFAGVVQQLGLIGGKFNILTFFPSTLNASSLLDSSFSHAQILQIFCCSSHLALIHFSFVFAISAVHQALLSNPASSGYQTLVGVQQPSPSGQPINMGNQVQGVMVPYPPLQSYQVLLTKCI